MSQRSYFGCSDSIAHAVSGTYCWQESTPASSDEGLYEQSAYLDVPGTTLLYNDRRVANIKTSQSACNASWFFFVRVIDPENGGNRGARNLGFFSPSFSFSFLSPSPVVSPP
jgi:hypothetical protein